MEGGIISNPNMKELSMVRNKEIKVKILGVFWAMKSYGVSNDKISSVLKVLLKLDDSSWGPNEDHVYSMVADSIRNKLAAEESSHSVPNQPRLVRKRLNPVPVSEPGVAGNTAESVKSLVDYLSKPGVAGNTAESVKSFVDCLSKLTNLAPTVLNNLLVNDKLEEKYTEAECRILEQKERITFLEEQLKMLSQNMKQMNENYRKILSEKGEFIRKAIEDARADERSKMNAARGSETALTL